jgi:rhamnogalacturonan endolyase
MRTNSISAILFMMLILSACIRTETQELTELQGFVYVGGREYTRYGETINLGDFEILDHPVSNREYRAFVEGANYPVPLHWENGKIPEGKEDFPVIFINRDDAEAYTRWLTQTTGRVHRIPTTLEFEIAARGGKMNSERYYWGENEENLNPDLINFNLDGKRKYDQWEKHLKPAKWGVRNDLGLYQMCGNVWQLVSRNKDPLLARYMFRIEKITDLENSAMGGSWASPKDYLVCGMTSKQPPGIRCPDLGIRLVREPEGANWRVINRKVSAIPHSPGKIGISWALLDCDTKSTRFNIYRLTGIFRMHDGVRLNTEPLVNTSFVDENGIVEGTRYQYRVVSVNENGEEQHPSEWAAIIAGADAYPIVVKFKPLFEKGGMLPVFGDIEGYGKLNCVIRLDNGCREMSQDPGLPVRLEAFSYTGKSLWRKDIARHENIFGSASNCPFNVWDMDGDGKDEVITLYQSGNDNYLAILDGMSGRVLNKTLWDIMATDYSLSSTRIQMSVAYLDGKNPVIITQTGIYENEIISAFDKNLEKLWTYKSFMETSGSGGHKVEIADVDMDGKQEVIYGTTCLNTDGTFRWSIYCRHPDIISIHDYIPERLGLEICFIIESPEHAGIYMVDADNGEIIWKNNREDDPVWTHGHTGWTADIWAGSPGMECMTNRAGHDDKTYLLFSSSGMRLSEQFPVGYTPFEWDGDDTRELLGHNGKVLGNFNGSEVILDPEECPNPVPHSRVQVVADLCGDFRSEMVIDAVDADGRAAIMVIGAPEAIEHRYLTPSRDIEYRLWLARNKGGGYGSVFEYVLADVD